MTASMNQDGAMRSTSKGRPVPLRSTAALPKLRDAYGLDRATLARMVGVSAGTLARWERGVVTPDGARLGKIKRVGQILKGLARVMKKDFISTWLSHPNDACEGRSPVDFLEEGDYETIEDLVYFLEAGEPV